MLTKYSVENWHNSIHLHFISEMLMRALQEEAWTSFLSYQQNQKQLLKEDFTFPRFFVNSNILHYFLKLLGNLHLTSLSKLS